MKILFLLTAILLFTLSLIPITYHRTDAYSRNRVVMLKSIRGSCTGVEVRSPKGNRYTLTAGHCRAILVDDKATAVSEQGFETTVKYVMEDPNSDLIILSPSGIYEADIAEGIYKHEHIHTMTHGDGQPTYRTDGELLEERLLDAPIYSIMTPDDMIKCLQPKFRVAFIDYMNIKVPVCYFTSPQMFTTAMVLHGSSGGPLLNDDNQVVGIVSTLQPETGLSTFVTLRDIKNFLKDK